MVARSTIDDFLAHKNLALAGVSRGGKGFGNSVRQELTAHGYTLALLHPEATEIEGQPCAKSLAEVASHVEGLVVVTPPAVTERLVEEAIGCGVRRIWMQQGAESPAAIRRCEQAGISVVHGECILMFAASDRFPHGFHGRLRRLFGRMPA